MLFFLGNRYVFFLFCFSRKRNRYATWYITYIQSHLDLVFYDLLIVILVSYKSRGDGAMTLLLLAVVLRLGLSLPFFGVDLLNSYLVAADAVLLCAFVLFVQLGRCSWWQVVEIWVVEFWVVLLFLCAAVCFGFVSRLSVQPLFFFQVRRRFLLVSRKV